MTGLGRSGRWGRCFTRVGQAVGPQRAGAGRAALPTLPPLSREGRRTPRRALGGESGWTAKPARKETRSLSPAHQLSFEGGPRLSELIPDGGTPRSPAGMHGGSAKGSSDTRRDTLLSGRCVGSNFPVQTGISKLLCIDYIYPAPLSAPRPAARVPPAAAAPPRPGPGVASGSGYNSRGKRQ